MSEGTSSSGSIEASFRRTGYRRIAGVDEVGRGALAGPMLAVALILSEQVDPAEYRDSKELSPARREALAVRIASVAECAWAWAGPRTIDRIGVHAANVQILRRAIQRLDPAPEIALIDAHEIGPIEVPTLAVTHGERRSPSIAAASIVAKVARDRLMMRLGERYPGWGFENHKGYGTKRHAEAIAELGLSPIHQARAQRLDPSRWA